MERESKEKQFWNAEVGNTEDGEAAEGEIITCRRIYSKISPYLNDLNYKIWEDRTFESGLRIESTETENESAGATSMTD